MKKLVLFLSVILSATLTYSQNTTFDNYTGDWSDNSSWVDNSAPSASGGYHPPITVYGYITRTGNLTINNGTIFTLNDTLWVTGDLTISGGAQFTVAEGGLLVVEGETSANNGAKPDISGLAIFMDDVTISGINGENFNREDIDNIYVYGTTTLEGADRSGAVSDETDLANDHTDLYTQLGNGTLPIELVSFTASSSPQTIQLMWTTAMEENFDFFTVERADANLQFEAVGTVKGNGFSTSPVNYDFEDTKPQPGVNYYRLKATDLDGSAEYHKVISIFYHHAKTTELYPNPVINQAFTVNSSATHLTLLNSNGLTVLSQKIGSGAQLVILNNTFQPGAYIALLTYANGEQERQHLIIAR